MTTGLLGGPCVFFMIYLFLHSEDLTKFQLVLNAFSVLGSACLFSCPRVHSSECQRRYARHTICLRGQSQTSWLHIHDHHSSLWPSVWPSAFPRAHCPLQMEWAPFHAWREPALCAGYSSQVAPAQPELRKAFTAESPGCSYSCNTAELAQGTLGNSSFLQRVEGGEVLKELWAAA